MTPTRFTQPEVLYEMGTELLTKLFDHFKEELAAKNIVIPNPNLAQGHYYESVAEIFKSPANLPENLVGAVLAIEELASPENKARLETAFWDAPQDIYLEPQSSPEHTALKLWLHSPYCRAEGSTTNAPSSIHHPPSPAQTAPPGQPAVSLAVIPASGHRRQGKVARLPKAVRDKLNFLILDGLSYTDIIKALGEDGEGLNEDMLSRWKLGGHQEWLTEEKDMEDMHLREEYTLQLVKENGGTTLNEATIKMATAQIRQALRAFGQNVLQSALEDNSQNYIRLINALARLTSGAITCQHNRVREDQRQASLEKGAIDPANLAITPETLRKIEELLRIR